MSVVNAEGIINALCVLSEHEELRAAIKESAKGALIAGSCAFVGGVLGGPIGLGVGGAIGAALGAANGMGKYKPVAQIILQDMTPEQRDQLAISFIEAFKKVGTGDVMVILSVIMNNQSVKAIALDVLKAFLNKQGYAIQ